MPELPDVELYLHALAPRILGRRLAAVRLANPFLLPSIDPPAEAVAGQRIIGLREVDRADDRA